MEDEKELKTLKQGEFSKEKVIAKLKENLKNHNELYKESVAAYWELAGLEISKCKEDYFKGYRKLKKQAIENFETLEELANKKEEPIESLHIQNGVCYSHPNLPKFPKSYAKAYEKTIEWLDLSSSDQVILTESEFDNYIMDNWEFKNDIKNTNSALYGGLVSNSNYITGVYSQVSGMAVNF